MNLRAAIVVSAWALGLVASGCSSSPLDGAGTRDQFISQLCEEFASCCTTAALPVDGAKCRAHYSEIAPAGYDRAKANACLREVRALGAEKCAWISDATPSCEQVFADGGTAKPGEACQNDNDCALSAEGSVECMQSVVDDTTFIQQCQLLLPGAESSSPCVGTVKSGKIYYLGNVGAIPTKGYLCDVADGLTCESRNGACKPLRALGEDCNLGGSADCVTSAYCDFNDDTCKERLELGSACSNDDWCQATAYCQSSDLTCVARRAQGQDCASVDECLTNSCLNQKCEWSNDFALVFLCGR